MGDSGVVNLNNVAPLADQATIEVHSKSSFLNIKLNGKYFHGRYNIQTKRGLIYLNPTSYMLYQGDAPSYCSDSVSWRGMPTLRPGVPHQHGHCDQGVIGYSF